ncbi:putative carbohydrate sulfotransferase 15 [Apostichopus japonicus]|uniref:Putative carbohydrate sulfotransferase 15 n=1 Tax=Stichopus japonicus TaxID=307972 RepID=A0A2G8LNQ5_STIJA|nr:putative carbohydrate sulfotransferase 15 [Apostichopus japonicus]
MESKQFNVVILTFAIVGVCLYIYWPDDSYIPLPLHENLSLNQIDERRELPLAGDASSGRLPPDQWKSFLPELFDHIQSNFSSKYHNPCWEDAGSLRCLPYFYQIGSYKCGTTDLWDKLVQHPDVLPVAKEPHWWAWRRFGYTSLPLHKPLILKIRNITGEGHDRSLQWYYNFISDQAITQLKNNSKLVFGDASISNLWGLADFKWQKHFPNAREPPIYLADLIHTLQPKAKITAILRNPVDKLWTTYMLGDRYKKISFKAYFDSMVKKAAACEKQHTIRYCAFVHGSSSPTAPYGNHLYQGKYAIYLREWVETFGLENIHVLRLEDWKNNTIRELDGVIRYLDLEPLTIESMNRIVDRSVKNVNKKAVDREVVMTPSMRSVVEEYYRPWNVILSELLKDPKYLWH